MSETFYAVTEGMKGFGHRGVFSDSEGHGPNIMSQDAYRIIGRRLTTPPALLRG
jgi:hypothetical protein